MRSALRVLAVAMASFMMATGAPAFATPNLHSAQATDREWEEALAAADAARSTALTEAERRRDAVINSGKRLLAGTLRAQRAAETTYSSRPSLANFRTLARARALHAQAGQTTRVANSAAEGFLVIEKRAINAAYDATLRAPFLWHSYRNNGLDKHPCVTAFMPTMESASYTQVEDIEVAAMSLAKEWQSLAQVFEQEVKNVYAAEAAAAVNFESARRTYLANPTSANKKEMDYRASEVDRTAVTRSITVSTARGNFSTARENLMASSRAAIEATGATYEETMAPAKARLEACLP